MKKTLGKIPWFYLLLTVYPLLFMWMVNVSAIDRSVVMRPFLVTLLGSAALYGILFAIFRNTGKAGLIGSLMLVAFFTYGHLYYLARTLPALAFLSHHITLIPIYLVLFGLGIWGVLRIENFGSLFRYLNLVSLLLVVLQVFQLSYAYIGSYYASRRPVTLQSGLTVPGDHSDLPDIYLIVLDSYTRQDAMQQDLGFDNSQFIDQLKNIGFYVAPCSRANYRFTVGSMAATLNMQYYPTAYANDIKGNPFWTVINNNEVRRQLESVGYKTVSFLGDDPRVAFPDANILFQIKKPGLDFSSLHAFEAMYFQSTAGIIFRDIDVKLGITQYFSSKNANQVTSGVDFSGMGPQNKDLIREHVTAQLFFLEKLPTVAGSITGPKFTYAHLTLPHFPYVFAPDGSMLADPLFYSWSDGDAVDTVHQTEGYLSQVQYINSRIIPILQTIIADSKTPPIIVLMGDHGLRDKNRYVNLNAYYLPKGSQGLYPSISPVNSFRVILNEYFGANYPILPDISNSGDGYVEPESYPDCMP